MKIIGADQRLSETRGVKALITGPTGVGWPEAADLSGGGDAR
jgi:hypothetical protein